MKTRNKTLCVLKALFQGYRIKLSMGKGLEQEYYWDIDRLCVDFDRQIPGKANKKYPIGFQQLTLSTFVRMCEKKTNDEIFIINANMTLTKINKIEMVKEKGK